MDGDAIYKLRDLNDFTHEIRYKQNEINGTIWCLLRGADKVVSFDIATMGCPHYCQYCGQKLLIHENTLEL